MKRKYAWIALIAAAAVVLPLRLYGSLFVLESKTGFYSDGGRISAITAIFLAAFAILASVLNYRSGGRAAAWRPFQSVSAAISLALTGVVLLFVSLSGLFHAPSGDGAVIYRVFSAAGIAAGIVFLAESYGFATGAGILEKHPLVALIPSVWGCLGMMVLFVEFSAVVNVADNAYYTCTVIFLLLFLFSQAKLFTGIESEKSGKMIYITGMIAVLLSFSTALPGITLYAMGETQSSVFLPVGLHVVNLLLALYILCFLLSSEKARGTDAISVETEKPDETEHNTGVQQTETLSGAEDWVLNFLPEKEGGGSLLKPEKASPQTGKQYPEEEKYARSLLGQPELFDTENPPAFRLLSDFLQQSFGGSETFVEFEASPFLSEEEDAGS